MTVFRPADRDTWRQIMLRARNCWWYWSPNRSQTCHQHVLSPTHITNIDVTIFLEITRLFSEDDFAENNCFDGKNLYAYPCRGKCFQYIGLYESNVIYDFIILLPNWNFFMNYFKWKMFTNLIVKQSMIDAIESSNVDAQQIIILTWNR